MRAVVVTYLFLGLLELFFELGAEFRSMEVQKKFWFFLE